MHDAQFVLAREYGFASWPRLVEHFEVQQSRERVRRENGRVWIEGVPRLRWGSSPRGAQTLALASKVRALLEGRYNVSFEDVRRVYLPAMRHRVIVNFEAQAEGIEPDTVLLQILDAVPETDPDVVG